MPSQAPTPLDAAQPGLAVRSFQDAPPAERGGHSDGELLRLFIQQQDASAFRDLVERHGPLVFSTALRVVRDLHAAEDVFQATFLVLARDGRRIRKPDSLSAWLHSTSLKIGRRVLARRRREEVVEMKACIDDQESPFELLRKRVEQQQVDEELQRLPDVYRAPLILHVLEGHSCEETAEILGTTVGAVRGRLQRGKRELKLKLLRRGIELSTVLIALAMWRSAGAAACQTALISTTVSAAAGVAGGTALTAACSPEAVYLMRMETTMFTTMKTTLIVTAACCAAMFGWWARGIAADQSAPAGQPASIPRVVSTSLRTAEVLPTRATDRTTTIAYFAPKDEGQPAKSAPTILKYGDGKADGKKSIAGTGEMIRFKRPHSSQRLLSLRIHGARYGTVKPPDEDVEISIVSEDGSDVVHTEFVPYAKFKRGTSRWMTIPFADEVEVPETFWVILDFNAAATKGVYVSYDSATGGEHSRTGLPGGESKPVSFQGDWMVQAILTKAE